MRTKSLYQWDTNQYIDVPNQGFSTAPEVWIADILATPQEKKSL